MPDRTIVSIPIGFSSSLQLSKISQACRRSKSFNPYRVFKFVATAKTDFFATYTSLVSIPIGFSSSLQPGRSSPAPGILRLCFNPYRVFKFVATLIPTL